MELVAAVPAGAEVFNTYGDDLSNAELMCRYGFILDDNEHDKVSWTQTPLYTPEVDLTVDRTEQHRRFFDMMQRAVPHAPQWDESELVYNPVRRPACSRPCFNVNADGSLSHDLWLWAATLVLTQHDVQAEEEAASMLVAMCDICLEVEYGADNGAETDDFDKMATGSHECTSKHHQYVFKTFGILYSVIEQRLSLIGHEHTASDIGDILDVMSSFAIYRVMTDLALQNTSINQYFTRMVLAEVLAEFSILEACQAKLQALLDSPD
jgi:hypothetical protein